MWRSVFCNFINCLNISFSAGKPGAVCGDMMDDVLAGFYANILLQAVVAFKLF